MSETKTPVSAVLDLQRNVIEQTHESVQRGLDTHQEHSEVFLDVGPAKRANESSYDAVRTLVDAYFDAVESTTPGEQDRLGDFRATVDEQVDVLEANQGEAIEAVAGNARDGAEPVGEVFERLILAFDELFETLLEAHADAEDQTLEAFHGVEGNVEALQAEFESQLAQFEEQVTELQHSVEVVGDRIAESGEQQAVTQTESLDTIDGIGVTYVDRLQDQGIESFEALAEATTDTVAEAADVSRDQANEWIDAAQPQA